MEENGNMYRDEGAREMSEERKVTFEIKRHIGVISANDRGWQRELNLVSWNGGNPKYDIREWDPHHERMSKGITLRDDEMRKLAELVMDRDSEEDDWDEEETSGDGRLAKAV